MSHIRSLPSNPLVQSRWTDSLPPTGALPPLALESSPSTGVTDLALLLEEAEQMLPAGQEQALAALTAALLANFGGLGSTDCPCCPSQQDETPVISGTPPTPAPSPRTRPPGGAPGPSAPSTSSVPSGEAGGSRPVASTDTSAPVGESQPNAEGYAFPVQGYQGKIELHHGSNRGGSDIFAPRGTPVMAMRDGTVVDAGTSGVGGNNVLIQGDDNLMYYYAHMDQTPLVQTGQKVEAGQQLGAVGDSGNAKGTGPHLHIGIGPSIVNGVGPAGGTGGDFDAVGLLNQVLQG